jgi:hypothetical protein
MGAREDSSDASEGTTSNGRIAAAMPQRRRDVVAGSVTKSLNL